MGARVNRSNEYWRGQVRKLTEERDQAILRERSTRTGNLTLLRAWEEANARADIADAIIARAMDMLGDESSEWAKEASHFLARKSPPEAAEER